MKPYDWRKMKTIEGLPLAAPKNATTATTTQCKLQNKCSFVCVHICKCLVGRGKHHQCKLQLITAGWMQVMCAP